MRLSDLVLDDHLVVENVEKLTPHLKELICTYLNMYDDDWLSRSERDNRLSSLIQNIRGNDEDQDFKPEQIDNPIVTAVLNADPKYLADKKKGKDLNKCKAPFAKTIIRWWLSPKSSGLTFPEDVPETAAILKSYNIAKQKGLTDPIDSFDSWDDFLDAIEPYVDVSTDTSKYGQMGFDIILEKGPWRVYNIDRFVAGEHEMHGQKTHAAMDGTSWCVKYHNSFINHGPPYYLVLHRGKKFALIHIPHAEYKTPLNRQMLDSTMKKKGIEFLTIFFEGLPEIFSRLINTSILAFINNPGNNTLRLAGDFKKYPFEIPSNEVGAEMAKYLTPSIKGFINGYDIPIRSIIDNIQNATSLLDFGSLVSNRSYRSGEKKAKVPPEITKAAAVKCTDLILSNDKPIENEFITYHNMSELLGWTTPESVIERVALLDFKTAFKVLAKFSENNSNATVKTADNVLDNNLTNLSSESQSEAYLQYAKVVQKAGHRINNQRSNEFASITSNPRFLLRWIRIAGLNRWPEVEPLIAQDHRAVKTYERITGHLLTAQQPTTAKEALSHALSVDNAKPFEPLILQDLNIATEYATNIKGRWPELEDKLEKEGTPEQIAHYRQALVGDDLYQQFGY